MDSYPSVTVVMPAYQAERTIGGAISSVLTQAYPGRVDIVGGGGRAARQHPRAKHQPGRRPHTPLAGMPLRATGRGAVSAFQVESDRLTAPDGGRATNSPCPSAGFSVPSSTITRPRLST